ncbi:snRNA-activating protein complex subunit 3 isoform X2 [Nematostella vectensis]|uniref:snRNA-activating protein complex subunit 3 isoform X2 n=1 Tax=Nematostella vectensis TaxID=45351 RepID=UPI0020774885|nr:snRNA-activating protein complex subunit 3 isoform X2 [Nematostella vectensis]
MEARVDRSDISCLISVQDFKTRVTQSVSPRDYERTKQTLDDDELTEEMGIPKETVAELRDVCSPHHLEGLAEPKDLDSVDIAKKIPEGVELKTLRLLKERRGHITHFRKPVNYLLKEVGTEKCSLPEFQPIPDPEVVLSVAVYHPKKPKKVQEFLVLGEQKLTTLRDKIYCNSDHIVPGDHSENPDLSCHATARDICKSGFFFIEEVFYNDMRDPSCKDYSALIKDWSKENGVGIFTSQKMETKRFDELVVRLGYPYVYCHQGDCEHLIIFTDLRPLSLSKLPIGPFRVPLCPSVPNSSFLRQPRATCLLRASPSLLSFL